MIDIHIDSRYVIYVCTCSANVYIYILYMYMYAHANVYIYIDTLCAPCSINSLWNLDLALGFHMAT